MKEVNSVWSTEGGNVNNSQMIKIGIVPRFIFINNNINKKTHSYLILTIQSLFINYVPGTVLVNGNTKINTLILPLRISELI